MADQGKGGGMTRRDLFSMFRLRIRDEAPQQPSSSSPSMPPPPAPLRPPGALAEAELSSSCIRCGACVEACPRQAIFPLPALYGAAAGTPHIVPRRAPCVMCHGLLCTHVCPSGALRPVHLPSDVHMGRAVLRLDVCLPYHGQPCTVCHDKCPVPGAITLDEHGRPAIRSSCTGCGLCEYFCPTNPVAVRVVPAAA